MAPRDDGGEYYEGDEGPDGDDDGYVEGDDDDDEEEESDLLGAIARLTRGRRKRRTRGKRRRKVWRRPPLKRRPAQATTSELRSYMGFGSVEWEVADGTNKVTLVEPQESFRGERLIIDTGIDENITNTPLTLLDRIDIGTLPQSPSVEFAAPAAMFRADATNANLDLQIAFRGTKIQVTLGITAAPTGPSGIVTVSLGMFGQWIR